MIRPAAGHRTPSPVIPIPFTVRHATENRAAQLRTVMRMSGLVGMDGDDVVLQYRVKTKRTQAWIDLPEAPESAVSVVRVPLGALRRAELRSGWFRTRLVLYAADLRAFETLPWPTGSELALTIPRAERTAAADLASSIELALSTRLLDGDTPTALNPGTRLDD